MSMNRLFFAFIALFALVRASDDPSVKLEGVTDLTPKNFDSIITNSGKHALIEFYAPWCGHCKRLVPEYAQLGALVAKDPKLSSRVVIAKVNADEHRELGERFEIRGFPTIKFFSANGAEPRDYDGPRSAEEMFSFLETQVTDTFEFARVAALEASLRDFLSAEGDSAAQSKAKANAEKVINGLSSEEDKINGELYVSLMDKAISKGGKGYFAEEQQRLERVLATGSVAGDKAALMSRKISILSHANELAEEM